MKTRLFYLFLALGLVAPAAVPAQTMVVPPAPAVGQVAGAPATPRPAPVPNYFDPKAIHPELIIGPPPQMGTKEQAEDLAAVHKIHDSASPELVKFAQDDARSQNIFLFKTIFGPGFNAQALPLTAALGSKLVRDAGIENGILKAHFQHKRPYQMDATLPSFCGTDTSFSYPSGHSMAAYLLAYAMTEVAPEKSQEIMARADQFAEHRVVCGVHFYTDIHAGKLVSLEMFGYMQSNPAFQHDVEAARAEIRGALHLDAPSTVKAEVNAPAK